MVIIYVLAGSVIFQLIAAVMAIRMIRFTGKRLAWVFISTALILMTIRRIIPLYGALSIKPSPPPEMLIEVIGLVLSFFMALGIGSIAPIFSAIKTSEEESKKDAAKAREDFRKTFHTSPVVMSITSLKNQRYVEVNEAYEKRTGYSRDEVIGRTMEELNLWAGPQSLEEVIRELTFKGGIYNKEFQFRIKNGDLRTVSLSIVLIDFNGEPCALTTAEDRSDYKRSQNELNKKIEELELFNKVCVDRELLMVQQKKKIAELEEKLKKVA